MEWFRIPKEKAEQPKSGSYKKWKERIAKEGKHQCVYCCIHEAQFGGIRNFHVEHFRPKSISRFSKLENDITNLYYSCSICNCFKGDDWPNDPVEDNAEAIFYIDPSQKSYKEVFDISKKYKVEAKHLSGKYMIEKVFLNRPQLIQERKTYIGIKKLENNVQVLSKYFDRILNSESIEESVKRDLLKSAKNLMHDSISTLTKITKTRPYISSDIKRK
ncbi:HNH endonuclease [Gracilimonas sp.]|uniref:HNH endonuclease n=1 Tax=Gracilimonas sp. TaxID=1974203 RepID=UPI003BA85B05